MKISVVIPVFNGGDAIKSIYNRILEYELSTEYTFELILVFDKGTEYSYKVLKELQKTDSERVKVYYLAQHCGQHKAIIFGFSKSEGELIVTMDDDLQHNPEDIVKLLNKQKENNFDVVYGYFPKPEFTILRKVAARIILKLFTPTIKTLYKNYSSFRLLKKAITLKAINNRRPIYDFIDANIGELTGNISHVYVKHNKSTNSKSNYTWRKLLRHFIMILITYSKIIRELMISGFLILILSVIFILMSRFNGVNNKLDILIYLTLILGGIFLLMDCLLMITKNRNKQKFKEIEFIDYTN